jgi:RNA polymerase sigma factor (sigma-70 family)
VRSAELDLAPHFALMARRSADPRGVPVRTQESRPLLTAAQEIELAARVHGSCRDDSRRARDELVLHNFGLAGRIVKQVVRRRPGRDYDDLFSEALLALIAAAEKYNPARHPVRFSTYATPAIHNRLRHYTDGETLVRVPNYVQDADKVARLMEQKTNPLARRKLRDNLRDAQTARRVFLSLSTPDDLADMDCCPVDPRPTPLEAIVRHEDLSNMLEAFRELDPIKAYCHVITRVMCNNELDCL